jgi:hypothetical protein
MPLGPTEPASIIEEGPSFLDEMPSRIAASIADGRLQNPCSAGKDAGHVNQTGARSLQAMTHLIGVDSACSITKEDT